MHEHGGGAVRGPVFINADFNPRSPFFFRQTIQIVCGAMVLSLGILLQSAPFSPHFTHVFSTLLKAAYPFIGGLCVSRNLKEGEMG